MKTLQLLILICVTALLSFPQDNYAADRTQVTVTGTRRPLGCSQILNATLATATKIVLPTPVPGMSPGFAIVQVQGGNIRWKDDGVAPTATVGLTLVQGQELDYIGDATMLQMISSSGTPIVDVCVYF